MNQFKTSMLIIMMALTTGCPSAQKSLETADTSKTISPENKVTNPSVTPATVDTKTSDNQTPIEPNSKDKKDSNGIDPKIAGVIILGTTALGAFLLHKMKAKPAEVTDLPKKPIRLLAPAAESETIPRNKQSFKNNREIVDLILGLSPNPTTSEVNKIVHTIRKQGPIVFSTFTEFKNVESKREFINLLFPGDAAVQYYRENLNIDNKVTKGEFIGFFQETCILMTKYYHGAIHSPQVKDSPELVTILKHDYRSNLQRFIQEIKDKADPNYNSEWLFGQKTGLLAQLGLL